MSVAAPNGPEVDEVEAFADHLLDFQASLQRLGEAAATLLQLAPPPLALHLLAIGFQIEALRGTSQALGLYPANDNEPSGDDHGQEA